jgi:hypothetical protein
MGLREKLISGRDMPSAACEGMVGRLEARVLACEEWSDLRGS